VCVGPGSVYFEPTNWWSKMRERWRTWRMSQTTRCVADDDPSLKEK
jgi:hypothetical protein